VEAEFETSLASNAKPVLPDGRQRVVRYGHDPIRAIQTEIGPLAQERWTGDVDHRPEYDAIIATSSPQSSLPQLTHDAIRT
jgi:hypothetical protein